MHTKRLATLVLAVGLVGLLAACGYQVQTTSGSQYLSAYAPGAPAAEIDADIALAADVEPQLHFPARLGLARIEHGALTPVPPADAEAWRALAQRLGSGYGEFVPISPLVAAFAAPAKLQRESGDCLRDSFVFNHPICARTRLADLVRQVRMGAARQHVDAVLIYETFASSSGKSNALAITKLALIGFFLPSEDVEAEGLAQAVLLDVRNGYTYGTATATSEQPAYRLTTPGNSREAQQEARVEAQALAVANLAVEVEGMVRELRLALAEQRQAPRAN